MITKIRTRLVQSRARIYTVHVSHADYVRPCSRADTTYRKDRPARPERS